LKNYWLGKSREDIWNFKYWILRTSNKNSI